jgi:hypothetical protein
MLSDCIGSASSATVLRNCGLRRPPGSMRERTGFALAGVVSGCVKRWNDRNTFTLSKSGVAVQVSSWRRTKFNMKLLSVSVRYCSSENNRDD